GSIGLDANPQDYVDIISGATELNGKITAQNLSLTQGTNRASYKDGTLTAIAGEGAQPQLAVDTKALGGMYANKIRLVANEEGVGVNLANLTSTQQGITLDTRGKIQLGNTAAKADLNITAKQTDIIKGATVKSERDITVASTTLNNNGTLSAGKDMRLFNDNLTNTQATIQANNNLWIQKDAVGNKGIKVENRSGTIKT
ncbi:hemagglutinin, partial [Candidatus Symbiopectobacterium sp. NZEC127]|nr:hemagglutinin [Candidatus Symbiopectobacterium sp. NZEC127]